MPRGSVANADRALERLPLVDRREPERRYKGNHFSTLQAVTAISPGDVWAVGGQAGIRHQVPVTVPLIEHWNGTRWSIVPAPKAALGVLESVSATSASDVWAVGAGQQNGQSTVALHFDGSSWKLVTVPTPPNTSGGLFGVKALSPADAWAVGESFPNAGGNGKILTDHWNGTSWQVVTAPPVGGPGALSALSSIDAAPRDGGVGRGLLGDGRRRQSVVLHWTGTAWQEQTTPGASNLFRVAVLPDNALFASDHGTSSSASFPDNAAKLQRRSDGLGDPGAAGGPGGRSGQPRRGPAGGRPGPGRSFIIVRVVGRIQRGDPSG